MRSEDVVEAERVDHAGHHELGTGGDRPTPAPRLEPERSAWVDRTLHLLRHDPGGCWVAEVDGAVVGTATSLRREVLWCLATYAVLPAHRGRGIGTQLLAAAVHHGRSCTRAMLTTSADPTALRLHHRAGFALHPEMRLEGTLDRSALPVVEKVRDGSVSDTDLMDSLDRATRGAGHGVDHELALRRWRLLVSDTSTGRGYAYLDEGGRLALLAADNRRTAVRLLWAVLADGPADVVVGHLTAANQWALDVGFAAGLRLRQDGYLGLRGMKPPAPYVHHAALL